jgi:CheY-like chemotaxis protein
MYSIVTNAPLSLWEVNDKFPRACTLVLNKALSKQPSARYATCQEFVGQLTRAVRAELREEELLRPAVMIVDDNDDLTEFLKQLLDEETPEAVVLTATSVRQGRELLSKHKLSVAVLDYLLPDGNGIEFSVEVKEKNPEAKVIVMTGAELGKDDEATVWDHGFRLLRKPFLGSDVVKLVRLSLSGSVDGPPTKNTESSR